MPSASPSSVAAPPGTDQADRGGGESFGVVGQDNLSSRSGVDAFQRAGCDDDGFAHGHRLQHLVLNAAGDPHGANRRGGMKNVQAEHRARGP